MAEPPDPDEEVSDIKQGMRDSPQGNPYVLLAINIVMSSLFTYTVLYLGGIIGVTEFTFQRFLIATAFLVVVTHVVVIQS